jgi:probable DNA metabolism protein
MKSHPYFLFDGSFAGFLNAIQKGLEESHPRIALNTLDSADTLPLFGSGIKIETNTQKAKRLWEDLGLLGTEFQKRVYYCFLHENVKLRPEIYQYVAHLFCPDTEGIEYLGLQAGKQLEIAVREVSRERDAQERVLSFKANADGLWYSEIRPKHDILPLLSRFCRSRFPSDPWLVLDANRKKSLSSVSGKLTLAACLRNVRPESRTVKSLRRVTDTARDKKTTSNLPPALSKTSSLLNQKAKKWEVEWGQKAV